MLQVEVDMVSDKLSIHWRYAAGNAYRSLEVHVRHFRFTAVESGHTYVDMSPNELVEVIDGFLSEPETVVPGGNRRSLLELRSFAIDRAAARVRCWSARRKGRLACVEPKAG